MRWSNFFVVSEGKYFGFGNLSFWNIGQQHNYSDFADVIPEAFEMVEKGLITEHDFREFTLTNAGMLHTRNNPGFFKGTVVEQAVADELGWKEHRPPRTYK